MEILYIMVLSSVLLALIFLGLFVYATRSGQFEEGESPAIRILFDDQEKLENKNNNHNE